MNIKTQQKKKEGAEKAIENPIDPLDYTKEKTTT